MRVFHKPTCSLLFCISLLSLVLSFFCSVCFCFLLLVSLSLFLFVPGDNTPPTDGTPVYEPTESEMFGQDLLQHMGVFMLHKAFAAATSEPLLYATMPYLVSVHKYFKNASRNREHFFFIASFSLIFFFSLCFSLFVCRLQWCSWIYCSQKRKMARKWQHGNCHR